MTITKATVYSRAIPLTIPYTIAYVTVTDTINHFVVLESEKGHLGIGCAAPAPDVTGETPELSRAALDHAAAKLVGRSLEDAKLWPDVMFGLRKTPAAMAAIDLALADLSARASGQSCVQWLGGVGEALKPVVTSVTIGIMSEDETAERAHILIDEGVRFLKIKGGHDAKTDIARLSRLRKDFGPDLLLALDANQGYMLPDVDLIERNASWLTLEYLEQPTPKIDLHLLKRAGQNTSIPIMADEAVQTEDDAKRIADLGTVQLFNIKLQKMGGLKESIKIVRVAEQAGMRTMLGCMDESALSIAAGLHFGAAFPNVQFYDLDGHLDLSDDPFKTLVVLDDGKLTVPFEEGLGWNDSPF